MTVGSSHTPINSTNLGCLAHFKKATSLRISSFTLSRRKPICFINTGRLWLNKSINVFERNRIVLNFLTDSQLCFLKQGFFSQLTCCCFFSNVSMKLKFDNRLKRSYLSTVSISFVNSAAEN